MQCPYCAKDIDEGVEACPECGSNLEEEREITAKINSAEVIREWEERADWARHIILQTTLGAKTDLGRIRENNEDKYEFFQPEDEDTLALKGAFYAVADGMGGHSAGQIASELALKTAVKAYYSDNSPLLEESLKSAVQQANAIIHDAARAIIERSGMGTTMTALVLRGDEAFIAQVGDSRCYRLRDGKFEQITEDHSWVQEQVKRGGMTKEEAEYSPYKNIITRSLGNQPTVEVDVFQEELEPGDVFLLCSDGLSGEVSDDEMRKALTDNSPSKAAMQLVELALDHGGRDNVTVLILAVRDIVQRDGETGQEQSKSKKKRGLGALFSRG